MENNICNSMILTSRRRHFYLVGQSKHKVGACGVNNQASAVLAGNELPFVAFSPDGHGYELVSSVRALVPQKFSVEEELMHVKHVEVKSPHVVSVGREVEKMSISQSSPLATAVNEKPPVSKNTETEKQ
ncbi:hypothetical protein TNCV_496811 [Trichonephila clavipes]|nr:hypothetical protein TNCV_496811 [Trichonephila clavipes]